MPEQYEADPPHGKIEAEKHYLSCCDQLAASAQRHHPFSAEGIRSCANILRDPAADVSSRRETDARLLAYCSGLIQTKELKNDLDLSEIMRAERLHQYDAATVDKALLDFAGAHGPKRYNDMVVAIESKNESKIESVFSATVSDVRDKQFGFICGHKIHEPLGVLLNHFASPHSRQAVSAENAHLRRMQTALPQSGSKG